MATNVVNERRRFANADGVSACGRFAQIAIVVGMVGACNGEQDQTTEVRSAIVDSTHRLFVPAYFTATDDTNWNKIYAHLPQVLVVNGPGSSPPAVTWEAGGFQPADPAWVNRINDIKSRSGGATKILGYIQGFYGRGMSPMNTDQGAWDAYGVDGYFFDQINRRVAEQDLPLIEFLADTAETNVFWGAPAKMVAFNFSNVAPYRQRWIDCVNGHMAGGFGLSPPDVVRYVTAENYADVFLANNGVIDQMFAGNGWINQYNPRQFVNLAHQRVGGAALTSQDVNTIFGKSFTFNAENAYVTDWTADGNTWGGGAPSQTIYDADSNATSTTGAFSGQDPASYSTAGCPPANSCLHDLCTRVWGTWDNAQGTVVDHDDDNGPPLARGCDPCVDRICDGDPYCCDSHWDQWCVGHMYEGVCNDVLGDPTKYNCSWSQG